jgi:hypothetical protein
MTTTHQANITYVLDDVSNVLVHRVAKGAIEPLTIVKEVRSTAGPATASGAVHVTMTVTYEAQGHNEALRTAKVAAAAIRPLVRRVSEPLSDDVETA